MDDSRGLYKWKYCVPTTQRNFPSVEVYRSCMIRVKAQADNGSLETLNNPPIVRGVQGKPN